MAFDQDKVLSRWATPCSDVEGLFMVRVVEEAGLTFCVRDNEFIYEFFFKNFGPCQVADEAFLESYQINDLLVTHVGLSSVANPLGWTRQVSNSHWEKSFNQGLMNHVYFPNGLQHYSIQTWDSCLDILAPAPPRISVSRISETK